MGAAEQRIADLEAELRLEAQRFPVRVRLENPPEHLMRLGASAVVEVKHGDKCS